MIIEALIYGLIPSATIEKLCNAPPEKISKKPKIDSSDDDKLYYNKGYLLCTAILDIKII